MDNVLDSGINGIPGGFRAIAVFLDYQFKNIAVADL